MSSLESLLFYISIDYTFHKVFLDTKMRMKFLSELIDAVPFQFDLNCLAVKNSGSDYLNFKYQMIEYACEFTEDLEHSQHVENSNSKVDFYMSKHSLFYLCDKYFSQLIKNEVFEYMVKVALYDGKFQSWKINCINDLQQGLNIDDDLATSLRIKYLNDYGFYTYKKNHYSNGQKLMAFLVASQSLLISGDIIDEEEKIKLNGLIEELDVDLPQSSEWEIYLKSSFNNYNDQFKLETDENERLMISALVFKLLVGDGDVAKQEKILLTKILKKFELKKSDVDILKKCTVLSIDAILKSVSVKNIL